MASKSAQQALAEIRAKNGTGKSGGFDAAKFRQLQEQSLATQAQPQKSPFLRSIGTGAAKELLSTGLGIGRLGRKVQAGISRGVDAVFGTDGFGMSSQNTVLDSGSQRAQSADQFLAPQGGAEKVGAFAAEVATYALPGAAASKAAKGASAAARIAAPVISDTTVQVAQSGTVNRDTFDTALISSIFPAAGIAKSAGQKAGLLPEGKDVAGRIVNSLVKPLGKDFSYGKNPGKAVAEAGIVANSMDDLASKIGVARQSAGQEISDRIAKSTARYDASDAVKSLDAAIKDAQKAPNSNREIIKRLNDVKADILQIGDDGVPKRKLTDLTANELWEFNKEIGDLARWTGNASDDKIVNKAIQQAYGTTRKKLDSTIPGLKDVSERYANLKTAENATIYREQMNQRAGLTSFTGAQLGGSTALITALTTGGAAIPTILVGGGVLATTEALKSAAVKTRVAAWLAKASPAEKQALFQQAPWLRSVLMSSLFGEEPVTDPPN